MVKRLEFHAEGLPDGWSKILLDDYVFIAGRIGWKGLKKSEYTDSGPYLLAVKDIDKNGEINYQGVQDHLSKFRYEESPEIKLHKDDILITKDGTIGKIGYAGKIPSPTTVNSSILVVRPSSPLFPKYLFHYFRSPLFQKIVREKIKGVAIPHLFQYDIKKFQLRVAPINEQHRIVSKLESIFGRIDACIDRLEKLVQQTKSASGSLSQLKSSILKQAFEGKLVPQDPNDEPAEVLLKEISKDSDKEIKFEKEGLPEGWVRTSIENISVNAKYSIRMGPFGSQLKKHELVDSGIRVLWIENIVNNKFENKKEKFITNEKYEMLKGFSVKPNDILITMMGTIGRTCVVPQNIGKAIISSHLLKISPHVGLIDPIFLTYLIRGEPQILKQIDSKSCGVVMKGLNTRIIKSLEFPLPPLPEQHRIVSKIESIFDRIDAIDMYVKEALRTLDMLKQSVLKQAFEGKLVPQDPNDEPASVLLERIRQKK